MAKSKRFWPRFWFRGKSKTFTFVLVFIVVLVAIRAVLPFGVQWYINKQLSQMKDYKGHVGDVDLSLIRGAYQVENIKLLKANGKVPVPFVSVKQVDLSVEWGALLKGEVVAEISLINPEVNFVDAPTPERSQKKLDRGWREVVDRLIPLSINRLTVRNGEVHFRNLTSEPPVDVVLSKVSLDAKNLSNVNDKTTALPSSAQVRGIAMKNAPFKLDIKLNALKEPVDFDLNSELSNLALTELNQFFRAYAAIDVESGTLDVSTEIAAKDGALSGYIKPIFTSLDVVELETDTPKGPFSLFWQSLTGTLADVIQNEDQQGAKIPIKGSLKNPKTDVMSALGSALKHAFDEPLEPGVEGTVNFGTASSVKKKDDASDKKTTSN